MRDDLPYFSHDNNAQDHPKMQALIAEYGFEGYGRFWALHERIAAHARDHPPEVCPGCGAAMFGTHCPACGGMVEFREQDLSWDFVTPADFNLAGDFRDKIRRNEVPRGDAKPVLDF